MDAVVDSGLSVVGQQVDEEDGVVIGRQLWVPYMFLPMLPTLHCLTTL